jgi:hypothetical protein
MRTAIAFFLIFVGFGLALAVGLAAAEYSLWQWSVQNCIPQQTVLCSPITWLASHWFFAAILVAFFGAAGVVASGKISDGS